jgi:hypothetical protein
MNYDGDVRLFSMFSVFFFLGSSFVAKPEGELMKLTKHDVSNAPSPNTIIINLRI